MQKYLPKLELFIHSLIQYSFLSYRQECFSEKQTTRKVHTKLHRGLEWHIFHILTSEDISDVISRFYTDSCLCKNTRVYNKLEKPIFQW